MIAVWYEDEPNRSGYGPRELVEALGIHTTRVEQLIDGAVLLVIGDVDAIANLSSSQRSRTVLVGSHSEDPASTREALGLLGVVDVSPWLRLRKGMLVVDGLFGRADVANRADLALTPHGLRSRDLAELPELLGRYLLAAERMFEVEG